MASPLMSPPHNGTPFIYFTERMSLVISTALKSYYLYVNDEWIECGCQEQYLFVSCGQPWLFFFFLFFNSISAPPLSVIDNWCGLTSLFGGCWIFQLTCRRREFTAGTLGRLDSGAAGDGSIHREPRLLGKEASEITKPPRRFKMRLDARVGCHLARAARRCLHALVSRWNYAASDCYFLFMTLFFWHGSKLQCVLWIGNPGRARSLQFSTEGSIDRVQRLVLHNTAWGKIQTSTFFFFFFL